MYHGIITIRFCVSMEFEWTFMVLAFGIAFAMTIDERSDRVAS
jgi:uncharacterized membrane protein